MYATLTHSGSSFLMYVLVFLMLFFGLLFGFQNGAFNKDLSEYGFKIDVLGDSSTVPLIIPSGTLVSPLDPQILALGDGFGMRINPVTGIYSLHNGVDLSAPLRTHVHASADGKVFQKGFDIVSGNYLKIISTVSDHELIFVYCHLDEPPILQIGDSVSQGDVVAFTGNTGRSTGPHLHFSVLQKNGDSFQKIDPLKIFDFKNKTGFKPWTY